MKNTMPYKIEQAMAVNPNPTIASSKKMQVKCIKDLFDDKGKFDFGYDRKYDVIEEIPHGLKIRNEHGYSHTVTEGGWLKFFYFC